MSEGIPLRLMSYNVHSLRDDLDALAAVVAAAAPDVLVVQEAPRRFRWRARCGDLAHRLGLLVGGGGLPSLGNLVLTNFRVRVHTHWCLRYPLTPGRHMRGAVFVRCSVGPARFVVAGSHLSTDAAERPAQAALLRDALVGIPEPTVLGIDANDIPGSACWRLLAESGLRDAAAGVSERPTFPVTSPRRRIDGIFVDPDVRLHGYQVFDHPLLARASDHFPLVTDLGLQTAVPPKG
jgi:endonuclease/exonuclease/phosphatase family metal-dependent hydrolase